MKGQTTIEYIIMISVILTLVGAALAVVSGGPDPLIAKQKASQRYWESADIGITSHQHEGTNLRIYAVNNLYNDISITKITIAGTQGNKDIDVGATAIAPAEGYTFILNHTHDSRQQGRNYEYDITFAYTVPLTGTTHTFRGQTPIVGRIQVQP